MSPLIRTVRSPPRSVTVTVLGLARTAQFFLQLDFSIVNVALPTIER